MEEYEEGQNVPILPPLFTVDPRNLLLQEFEAKRQHIKMKRKEVWISLEDGDSATPTHYAAFIFNSTLSFKKYCNYTIYCT